MTEQVVRVGGAAPAQQAAGAPACQAPFTSMYLDPAGRVTACCANTWHPLGDVTRQSLTEIWRGRAARRLRERLAAGEFGLGCELCAAELAVGSPATAELHRFAPLGPAEADPQWPTQLELALSNSCNLQCVMCNGELSSAIRIHREGRAPLPAVYGEAFFAELDEFLPHLRRVMFLGGEPFLGAEPMRVLGRLIDLDLHPEVYVTSNGTQWNNRVERALRSLPVDVSVSVDGFRKETVEAIRVGVRHDEVVRNIEHYRSAVRGNGGGFSLTFCLQRDNWRELGEVLEWGDRIDALVGVATLTNPPHLALHRLPTAALDDLVRTLHDQDRVLRPRLGRNQPVWDRELARLDALAADRRDRAGASAAATGDLAAEAAALAQAFADGRGVHRMHADGSQVVSRVEPDPTDVLGADLTGLVGGPTGALMYRLIAALGEVGETALDVHVGGIEERRVRFDRPGAATEVRAYLAPTGPTTHVWLLAAREVGSGDPLTH